MIRYSGEPLYPRGSVLALRPPGLESCVCRVVLSHSSHHPHEVFQASLAYIMYMCTKVAYNHIHFIFYISCEGSHLYSLNNSCISPYRTVCTSYCPSCLPSTHDTLAQCWGNVDLVQRRRRLVLSASTHLPSSSICGTRVLEKVNNNFF